MENQSISAMRPSSMTIFSFRTINFLTLFLRKIVPAQRKNLD
jgi:hypothetical protein